MRPFTWTYSQLASTTSEALRSSFFIIVFFISLFLSCSTTKGNEHLVVALAPKSTICQTILLAEMTSCLEKVCLRNLWKLGEGVLALPKLLISLTICACYSENYSTILFAGLAMVACVVKCDEHAIALATPVVKVNVSQMISCSHFQLSNHLTDRWRCRDESQVQNEPNGSSSWEREEECAWTCTLPR